MMKLSSVRWKISLLQYDTFSIEFLLYLLSCLFCICSLILSSLFIMKVASPKDHFHAIIDLLKILPSEIRPSGMPLFVVILIAMFFI